MVWNPKEKPLATLAIGLLLALFFVAVRGCNSANYLMAKRELPDMALMAVSSVAMAVVSLAASLFLENADWSKLWSPASIRWTLVAGLLSFVSVFAALRSYDFIPQWLTQSFIGLEPFFGTVGLLIVAGVVAESETRRNLLEKLPQNWWLFFGGLLLVTAGVIMMALSKASSGKA